MDVVENGNWRGSPSSRVARFSLVQNTKNGENTPNDNKNNKWPKHTYVHIPNKYKKYRTGLKYTKIWPLNGLPKKSDFGIFGMKIYHLATLPSSLFL
jgi:hypothetical protein